jgi:hypothetical protein
MSQEELLVLIYKKDEGHLHIYMIFQSLFSVINVLVKQRRSRRCASGSICKIWKNIDSYHESGRFYTWILNIAKYFY